MHEVVSSVGLLETKMHQARAKVRVFMGAWRGKVPNRTNKGAIGANKVRLMAVSPPVGGAKSGIFDTKCDGLTCKNVLPVWAGSTFSKK